MNRIAQGRGDKLKILFSVSRYCQICFYDAWLRGREVETSGKQGFLCWISELFLPKTFQIKDDQSLILRM